MLKILKRDITNINGDDVYLRRWNLKLPFGFSIKLHKIMRPDDDRCEHDHPWEFLRIILWGGYVEQRKGKMYTLKPWRPWAFWRIYPIRGAFRHRIDRLLKKASWSLLLCGRRNRKWGFFTRDGWMPWRHFVNEAKSKRVLWCDDGTVLNETD